jgi:hypothetical protein
VSNGKRYEARVEEVHSGDDFILLVDLGIDGLFKKVRARLFGVDAPNAYRARPDSEAGRIRDEVRALVGSRCVIELVSTGKGGWIVTLLYHDTAGVTRALNQLLQARGYVYTPQKDS